jgi:hypothetical protein
MRRLVLLLTLSFASTAHAQARYDCNAHGAVVTMTDGTVYYMGKDCDAAQKGGGTGKWYLAASAFIIEINGKGFRLPIEIDCDLPACWFTE